MTSQACLLFFTIILKLVILSSANSDDFPIYHVMHGLKDRVASQDSLPTSSSVNYLSDERQDLYERQNPLQPQHSANLVESEREINYPWCRNPYVCDETICTRRSCPGTSFCCRSKEGICCLRTTEKQVPRPQRQTATENMNTMLVHPPVHITEKPPTSNQQNIPHHLSMPDFPSPNHQLSSEKQSVPLGMKSSTNVYPIVEPQEKPTIPPIPATQVQYVSSQAVEPSVIPIVMAGSETQSLYPIRPMLLMCHCNQHAKSTVNVNIHTYPRSDDTNKQIKPEKSQTKAMAAIPANKYPYIPLNFWQIYPSIDNLYKKAQKQLVPHHNLPRPFHSLPYIINKK